MQNEKLYIFFFIEAHLLVGPMLKQWESAMPGSSALRHRLSVSTSFYCAVHQLSCTGFQLWTSKCHVQLNIGRLQSTRGATGIHS